jgi:ribosomal protein S18 acetylase RimI-like enzyme
MKQGLEKSYGLNQDKLAQIHQLELACNEFEGLTMKLNWNTLTDRPADQVNDFLYYVNDTVVAYLALYGFNQHEAEISAMTHPHYRRRGIFKQLLAAASLELQHREVPNFLFICERISASGIASVQALGAGYEFSEYKMDLQALSPVGPLPEGLQLRAAQVEDIKTLARMDELCFDVTMAAAQRWLEHDLADPQRQTIVATLAGIRIGKIGILINETETYIAGFCLLPEYRGRGYGKAILSHTVNQLVTEQRPVICLEVACSNEQALSLYRRCGFEVTTGYDYYRLPVTQAAR